jgi:predicted nucleic acid-binding protein
VNHHNSKTLFEHALQKGHTFLVHNYILLESAALFSRRLGWAVAHTLLSEAASFYIRWVDEALHHLAVRQWTERSHRKVSLVDQVSFLVMQEAKISQMLAFDNDFVKEGFKIYHPMD